MEAEFTALLEQRDIPEDVRITLKKLKTSYISCTKEMKRMKLQLKELIEDSPVGILEVDVVKNQLISVNDIACERTGYTKEELLSLDPFDLLPDETKNYLIKRQMSLLSGEDIEPKHVELKINKKDGSQFWVSVRSKFVFDDQGNIERVTMYLFDITNQKEAEMALKESEQRYRGLSEAAFEGIIIHDQGVIIEANQTYCKLLGYNHSEIIGSNGLEHAAPESRELIINKILSGSEEPYEADALRKDGTTFPVEIRAKKAKYLGIEVRVTAFRDLTYQKKAEEAIRHSEEKYRELFNNANDAIFLLEFNEGIPGKVIEVNDVACRRLEYSREELLKMSPYDFSDPDILNAVMPTIKQDFLTRGNTTFEMIHTPRISDSFPVEINSHLFTLKGKPVVLSIVRDVTERKEAEKMRLDLENRRKRFIETTSHELRTPLTNVKGFIQVLETYERDFTQEEKVNCFRFIDKNLNRLEILIRDVSDLAQIDRIGIRVKKQEIDFCHFINESILGYKHLLGDQFMVKSNCKTKTLVEIDKNRFSQILDNLINNAMKHTPKETRKIEMNVEISPELIRIAVSDNGAGIESSNLEMIFEPFVSIETKYSVVGAGIGLYLSRKIVESHGGT
ncbi:MAG: PAS domain S-box protein [Promethearchaeota archaeon]